MGDNFYVKLFKHSFVVASGVGMAAVLSKTAYNILKRLAGKDVAAKHTDEQQPVG